MLGIARIKVRSEGTVYHVMSRVALDGSALGNMEKDYLLKLVKRFSGRETLDSVNWAASGIGAGIS